MKRKKYNKHFAEQFDLPIMITVERRSLISGKINQMDLDVTVEQLEKYETGQYLVQDVFPNLSADEREFIKTGITGQEWNTAFAIK